jgi:hypothetical protein
MAKPEYKEGPKAKKDFEQGMIALFKVPKTAVVKAEKKKRKAASLRKQKRADKD